MASKASRRAARSGNRSVIRPKQAHRRNNNFLGPLMIGGAAVVAVAVGWFVFSGSSAEEPPAAPVGSDAVQVYPGQPHTVYHSLAPLPSTSAPQPEGLPTLVWFSGTWCEFCHAMEPFANATMSEFGDRMAYQEKSVDHANDDARRFRVRGTPTFVLLDVQGQEIVRFGFQRTGADFRSTIEAALRGQGS